MKFVLDSPKILIVWYLVVFFLVVFVPSSYYYNVEPLYRNWSNVYGVSYYLLFIIGFSVFCFLPWLNKRTTDRPHVLFSNKTELKLFIYGFITSILVLVFEMVFLTRIIITIGGLSSVLYQVAHLDWMYQIKLMVPDAAEGISFFLALEPVPFILLTLYYLISLNKHNRVKHQPIVFILIILLSIVIIIRSILWSERLIIINIIAPVLLLVYRFSNVKTSFKNILRILLAFSSILFFLILGALIRFKFRISVGVAAKALMLYFTGSTNNLFYLIQQGYGNITKGWFTLYPIVFAEPGKSLGVNHYFGRITGLMMPSSHADWFIFAKNLGVPEFINTYSGYGCLYLDWGFIGGILAGCILGVIIGYFYRKYINGATLGLLAYPILFTNLIDMPRNLSITGLRCVYPLCVVLVIYLLITVRVRNTS